jgi:hypothetical protein
MDLPIRFPTDVEVITEEVTRYRTLSNEDQVRTLGELFRLYHFLAARSSKPQAIARLAREDEDRSRAAIEDFVRRHG